VACSCWAVRSWYGRLCRIPSSVSWWRIHLFSVNWWRQTLKPKTGSRWTPRLSHSSVAYCWSSYTSALAALAIMSCTYPRFTYFLTGTKVVCYSTLISVSDGQCPGQVRFVMSCCAVSDGESHRQSDALRQHGIALDLLRSCAGTCLSNCLTHIN